MLQGMWFLPWPSSKKKYKLNAVRLCNSHTDIDRQTDRKYGGVIIYLTYHEEPAHESNLCSC